MDGADICVGGYCTSKVVDIVKDKTNVQDFDSLTNVFLNVIYAREKQVTEENLKAVCEILRMRLA